MYPWAATLSLGSGVPWHAARVAMDVAAIAIAVVVAGSGRRAPERARLLMAAGVLLAGLGPLLDSYAPEWFAQAALAASVWKLLSWTATLLGLLTLAAGAGRLASGSRAVRRHLSLTVLGALTLVALGSITAALATLVGVPQQWRAATGASASSVAWAGFIISLVGALALLRVAASGRATGPVPYRRRVGLVLAVALYAAIVAMRGLVLTASALSQALALLLEVTHCAALWWVAWSARRTLTRPLAATYWSAARLGTAAQRPLAAPAVLAARRAALDAAPISPRALGSPEPISGDVPVVLAALINPVTPFTPPALHRAVLAHPAPVPATSAEQRQPARASDATPRSLDVSAPVTVHAPHAPAAGGGASLVRSELSHRVRAPNVPNDATHAPLAPEFVAAVVRLQAEMARAGRTYEFSELLHLFSASRPRAAMERPLRASAPEVLPVRAPKLNPPARAPFMGLVPPDDEQPAPLPSRGPAALL
jgi:hypothetical protein